VVDLSADVPKVFAARCSVDQAVMPQRSGQPGASRVRALRVRRNCGRKNVVMDIAARALSDLDIAALATCDAASQIFAKPVPWCA